MVSMAAPSAVVPPVTDSSMYVVTWAFVSRINSKLMLAVIDLGGYAFRVYLPGDPAWPGARVRGSELTKPQPCRCRFFGA